MLLNVITVVCGILDVILGFFVWRLQRRVSGLTRPINIKRGRRNSIMLLGLGGVRKTTFVSNLFSNNDANPTASTEHYELYRTTFSLENPNNPRKRNQYTLFVGDYRGQNLGQLVCEFVTQQKKSFNPMTYGFINSLILVVDLFPPPDSRDSHLELQSKPDNKRIESHIDQWNETALDAVFGLLTRGSLQYVCLYINKSDLLENQGIQSDIQNQFSDLESRLRQRADVVGAQFQSIIGSASEGSGITKIRQTLFSTSVSSKS